MKKKVLLCITFHMLLITSQAQNNASSEIISDVEPQPLLAQAIRLKDALDFLGNSLSKNDVDALNILQQKSYSSETSIAIQNILDPYCLAMIDINPEARVKVAGGFAKAELVQGGWRSFLVKVHNEAGVTAQLQVQSENAKPDLHISSFNAIALEKNKLTQGQVENRFLEMQLYHNRPLLSNLSGLKLEYVVLQIYSKDAGQREAELGFNIGQGSQDIGFRNSISIFFNIKPAVKVKFNIKDDDGSPAMASFIITDGIERFPDDSTTDYRLTLAQKNYGDMHAKGGIGAQAKELTGIYPLPSRRVASYDQYPDFFFQPQVYRSDGEYVLLPPGKYNVTFTRGPEYITEAKTVIIPSNTDSIEISFQLKRWINLAKLGWYSADHHIHAAGCSHYESPEEGVPPLAMWRQIIGEDVNLASVLSWGPGWYHQKKFFTGQLSALSTNKNLMRYDVEVSGFPSSHAGHVVLLNLKEDDYPGAGKIEDWPSFTLPVLQWAKSQGAITGYAHSGWGLEPIQKTDAIPNYVMPKMDGIGANEYVVTVTQNVVDFFSAGDTPPQWELNMWYHTLNCGFKTRLSGETDFPCIFDERVGIARSYFKTGGEIDYNAYINAIKQGRSYVSDGRSHIINFLVNGVEAGVNNSELQLKDTQHIIVTASAAAFLSEQQIEEGFEIAHRAADEKPYWNIERSRRRNSRNVLVQLIVNGLAVDSAQIVADGKWNQITFNYFVKESSWIALRIYPSSHTNPVFVLFNGKPIKVLKSAIWCRQAVDQCWKMKQVNIRKEEESVAKEAYEKARIVYDKIIESAQVP